jgi:hypothetical protein
MSLMPARAHQCSAPLVVEGFMKVKTTSFEGVGNMGLTHVAVKLRSFVSNGTYEAEFLVDSGATDSLVPASELTKIGVQPVEGWPTN